MNKKLLIQLKAAFLLLVFSLNTMSGFACAMGVDMRLGFLQYSGINKDETSAVQEKKSCHANPRQSGKEVKGNAENSSRNCCGDKMIWFDKLDKTIVKSSTIVNPVFLNVLVSTFYDVDGSYASQQTPNIKYFYRNHQLPIPDIRLIIQSFQV